MSIMELGALGEFVAAMAVLITLIYLTIQVRGAREETTRAVLQSRAELVVGTLFNPIRDFQCRQFIEITDVIPAFLARALRELSVIGEE